jgi:carboxyl-terminal processing protease
MTGAFYGIGCQIDVKDGWLYVVSPLEDSPAFNKGIIAGDRITKVNGKSTQGQSTDKCIKMITGPEGSPVHLDVLRNGQEMTFDLERAKIVSKSVRGFRRLPDDSGHWDHLIDPETKTAYIRMSQFTPTTPQELLEALRQAERAAGGPLGGLILDLRNNPGGLMDAAIRIVDAFVDDGKIMWTKGRNTPDVVYKAHTSSNTPAYPIAILVNGFSASASEILAGSLKDHNRAIVIGTRTFGKGLVQSVDALEHDHDAIVKFTTQHYYLPNGEMIQRTDGSKQWGVDPSPGFFVPMSDAEAIAHAYKRRDWDILRKPGTELPAGVEPVPPVADQRWTDPAWIESAAKDKQLAGAVKTIKTKIAAGEWVKLNDHPDEHGQIAMAELKILEKSRERLLKDLARIEKRTETLDSLASTGKGEPKLPDFWPDSLDLTGGAVEVKDKDGKIIADLRITGRDLERWLAFADLEKAKKTEADTAATKTPVEHKQ